MPDTKHPGLQRKFWNTAEFPSFPIPDTRERTIDLSLGILLMMQQQTVLPVSEDMNCGIRPQAKKGNGLTAVHPKSEKTVPAELFVAQMRADSGYSQLISGRNISIWSNI